MRDFFISSFEKIVSVLLIIMSIAVILAGLTTMFSAQGGFLAGLGILIGGALYVLFMGGAMFLGLGIYQNTKRTAEAIEALARR